MAIKFAVESLGSAYGGRIPWDRAKAVEGLGERAAITMYNRLSRRYTDGNSWSGHVRIVGSDGWIYYVEPGWAPGTRAKLARLFHLDDRDNQI